MALIQAQQMVAFEWSMVALTFTLVVLRLHVQIRCTIHPHVPVFYRVILELLVVFAWVSFMAGAVMDTMLIPLHGLDPDYNFPSEAAMIKALKIFFAESVTYLNPMYAIKVHMLIFYHTALITPATDMLKTRMVLKVTTVVVVVAWLVELFISIFACFPISTNWSTTNYCSYHAKLWVYLLKYVPHMLTDLLVYFLPVPVLWRLRGMSKRQKLFATVSFGFGFLCVGFAASQMGTGFPTVSVPLPVGYTTAVMEQTWALLVVCVPAFKVFMRRTMEKDPESVVSLQRSPSDEKSNSLLHPEQREVTDSSMASKA